MSNEDYKSYCDRLEKTAKEYDYQTLSDKIEFIMKKAVNISKNENLS